MARRPQQRLGKGLSALLGDYVAEEVVGAGEVQRLAIADLRPNPFQPRGGQVRENLDTLVDSIRENGLLQPLLVRPLEDGGWELVAGERRWRAVIELGWSHVPAVVRPVDDRTMLILALIENLQREDLSSLDEAHAYQRLIDEFNLSHGEIAERLGRDRSTIANTVRLLSLPQPVLQLLAAGSITAGHARALLSLEDENQAIALARRAAEADLSVREVERLVKQRRPVRKRRKAPAVRTPSDAYANRAEQALSRVLGTSVRVRLDGPSRGKIEIPFRNAEDFERIVEVIGGSGRME